VKTFDWRLWLATAGLTAAALGAPNSEPYPRTATKKGLQVQMVDDALKLGVEHAALNVSLAGLLDPRGEEKGPTVTIGGFTCRFRESAFAGLDAQVKALSERGVVVSLILLNYYSGDLDVRRIMAHPAFEPESPNKMSAFNTRTAEGRAWLRAAFDVIAARWSGASTNNGRVWNWILGNEVNSHGDWCNEGPASMETVADDYLAALRSAHEALRAQSDNARLFVSLEHHWNIHYPGADERHSFPARPFLEYLAKRSREGGDFDWDVAHHPYPENLRNPRTWLDKTATPDFATTPRITFKNLEQLIRFLDQPSMRCRGARRHVILSEQGFDTPEAADGETVQAAAFCYAWKRVATMDGIDAFILHRHVDHGMEGGLRLGLWRRNTASANPCEPAAPKRSYAVFKAAGTSEEDAAFAFAPPIIGIASWAELSGR
jgi:Family of unknown function (DUF5722)